MMAYVKIFTGIDINIDVEPSDTDEGLNFRGRRPLRERHRRHRRRCYWCAARLAHRLAQTEYPPSNPSLNPGMISLIQCIREGT